MPTPSQLRAAAATVRAYAPRVLAVLDGVVVAAGPDVWRGRAADQLDLELKLSRKLAQGAARSLQVAAGELERRADVLDQAAGTARPLQR